MRQADRSAPHAFRLPTDRRRLIAGIAALMAFGPRAQGDRGRWHINQRMALTVAFLLLEMREAQQQPNPAGLARWLSDVSRSRQFIEARDQLIANVRTHNLRLPDPILRDVSRALRRRPRPDVRQTTLTDHTEGIASRPAPERAKAVRNEDN
jgi:hypothetical protein